MKPSSLYNRSKMPAAWKAPDHNPDSLPELHAHNSLYSSASSQQERQDAEMARNPSPVARLRVDHYDERIARSSDMSVRSRNSR